MWDIKLKVSKIFLILCLLFTSNNNLFAIEEKEEINSSVIVSEIEKKQINENLEFEDILKKAKDHSFDLKIADFECLIVEQNIRGARSEYFPKLYFNASTEYNKNFSENKQTPTTYVGDIFVNQYTRYQSVLGFTLAYNLFDFGIRKGSLDIAKEETEGKKLEKEYQKQELTLNIIDTYTKISTMKKQLEFNNEILVLLKKNLEMKERLFKAKEISKSDLNDQIVETEKYQKETNELYSRLAEYLNLLSFFTNEQYNIEKLIINEMKEPNINPFEFEDYTKTIVNDIHEKVINQKELALKVAKRQYLPKFNMYSRYYLYGSDVRSYRETNKQIEPSNWSIGASVNMPVFDGMKQAAIVEQARLEYEKSLVEKDKALADIKNRVTTMRTNLYYLEKQLENNSKIINELTEKEENSIKLLAQRIISPIEANQVKIDLLKEKSDFEVNKITKVATLKGIEALTVYDKEE